MERKRKREDSSCICRKKAGPRNGAMVLDVLHVALGLMIVVLGILTFLNPEDHMFFFPVIFFLGAVLNLADGIWSRKMAARGKKIRRWAGCFWQWACFCWW